MLLTLCVPVCFLFFSFFCPRSIGVLLRVRFVDRCLLEMCASRTQANLLLPNGFPLQITLPSDDSKAYKQSALAHTAHNTHTHTHQQVANARPIAGQC